MSIEMRPFGVTADGRPVTLYEMKISSGASVEVLDYGCTLHAIRVPDRNGKLTDVCLGYDTVAEYEQNDGYLGAVIGRHANRIGKGQFTLNGKEYSLAVNNGPNHLHGGTKGFDKYVWDATVASDRLIFSHIFPDGDEGYPGTLSVSVVYSFREDGTLSLTYDAVCDADTVVNFTNHCYFNLNGKGTALDLMLQVEADEFTENDADCLPTGKVFSVEGTPFDFRAEKKIGKEINADEQNLKNGSGYDHNFILRGTGLRRVATLRSKSTGIIMETRTTQPGIQIYSANFLTDRNGKGGVTYHRRDAVCLETQHFPDAVHHDNFPSAVLKSGEKYHEVTEYSFSVDHDNRASAPAGDKKPQKQGNGEKKSFAHWADEIAQRIVDRNPNKEEYVCAAGISPSGSIHIGNFRDVATSYFVVRSLRRMGKKARLLFSWDEYDRMRKVPVNVAKVQTGWEKYIGCPYVDVPNPFEGTDGATYAEYFEKEFEDSIGKFGIDMDYRHQAEMYRSGKYREQILLALKKRKEIFDIIDSHRTQDAAEGERDSYYPVSIYCPVCGRDTTKITGMNGDFVAEYECACGHHGTFDFKIENGCKLAWKVDWPMRWQYESVDFEPGGKDHASLNGSYDTSKDISKAIFGYDAPIFQGYEFIGIKGTTGKMSGSSGLNLTPETLLKLYQPEVILWLYSKTEPLKAFDFCFDDGILRQYFEFDKMLNDCRNGKADPHIQAIMDYASVAGREPETVPMSLLVQLGSVVDFNVPMLETVFAKIGTPYRYEQFADRLARAKFWLEQCAPEQVNRLRGGRNWDVYETLSEEEKKEISLLWDYLSKPGYSLDDLNAALYAIPRQVFGNETDEKTLKAAQGTFFRNVYRLLIDKEQGPRLYLFLFAIDTEKYLPLLDFSTPRTEAEQTPVAEETVEEAAPAVEYGEPDPVKPVKEQIEMPDFDRVDLRVCQVLKCSEIRKSHSCLKLVLDDGIGQRTIVSSIKAEYRPEDLIGKKIIVIANLKPTRITGVTSEGMLLAASNNACGCKVLFVDDSVPVGTAIH